MEEEEEYNVDIDQHYIDTDIDDCEDEIYPEDDIDENNPYGY